jgi:Site-specific recombinases, DNA invertase Pin homologs
MAEYGYIRVSTKEQNEERQLVAVREYGIVEKNIYLDKQSGKDFERPAYKRLIKKMKPGDTLVIKSIDRLGRNYDEILEQWRIINKEKFVAIVVLDMPLLDTRLKHDLTGMFIADVILQLHSYIAETERDFIRQRQAEGIAVAKANGVRFGKRPLPIPGNFHEIHGLWMDRAINSREAAARLKVSQGTFLKWSRRIREEMQITGD